MSSRKINKPGRDIRDRLAPYRISSDQTNAAYKLPVEDNFVFLKIYGPKPPRAKYEIRKFLNNLGMRQPVEYTSPSKRRRFESLTLLHWRANGFNVPEILDINFEIPSHQPVLTTSFIEGPTLRELLSSEAVAGRQKTERLEAVFAELATRHEQALANCDNRLLHIDANTRNIICSESAVWHVDFEMGRPWEPVVPGATREVLKLLVSIADDTGPSYHRLMFELFKRHYRHDQIYDHIASGITGRSFQLIHRFTNQRKKRRHPGKITLPDIAAHLL